MEQGKQALPQTNMRTFYILLLTQVFSLIGSNISGLAIGIWVYNDTGNATPLALVAFFMVVPQILVAGFSGALADRFDRRYMMAFSDAGQALGTLLLLFSFLSGNFQLWHLYLVVFIQAIFAVFQGPAMSASITMLVPDEQRNRANALMQMAQPSAGLLAPAITGLIYGLVGVTGAIIIDLLTFLIAVTVVLRVRIPFPKSTDEGQALKGALWKESISGFRYLWGRRPLLYTMLFVSLVNFLVAGTGVLSTPYILSRTNHDEAALGVIVSILNLGALVGGVLMGIWKGPKKRINIIMPSIALLSLNLAFVGMSQTNLALAITVFTFLIPVSFANAAFMALLQAKVAPDVQGRVFSVTQQLSMLLTPISFLLVGPLADNVFEPAVGAEGWSLVAPLVGTGEGAGMGLMFVILGGAGFLVTLLAYANKNIRNVEELLPDFVPEVAEGGENLQVTKPIPEGTPVTS